MTRLPLYIFGEVLFDCFPDAEPVLGGAPFNVAWHLRGFGENPGFISAVGNDELGRKITTAMMQWGLSTEFLTVHDHLPTGIVNVSFNDNEPSYEISDNCAYDEIPMPEVLLEQRAEQAFFYHGSLALRSHVSANNLARVLDDRKLQRFIDVNLRPPWWKPENVLSTLNCSSYVKMNLDELRLLAQHDRIDLAANKADWLPVASEFKIAHNIVHLLITQGAEGATLLDGSGERLVVTPPGNHTAIVDTVGAGDAFASVMLLGFLNDWDLMATMERAQEFANLSYPREGRFAQIPPSIVTFNPCGTSPRDHQRVAMLYV